MAGERKSVDLVLEGGGVKGIALVGAVLELYDAGYQFERIAGTSAGAICASLIAAYQRAGRDLHELKDVVNSCDFRRFEDGPLPERLAGKVGRGVEILAHEGAYSGDYLYEWLTPILEATGVTTFGDLRLDDPGTSLADYQRYSLMVVVTDLTRRCLVRLPWDHREYQREADDQLIVDAVRASMSFPYFFRPVQFKSGKGVCTWVDGGVLSDFPITAFDRTDGRPSRWPTWGIALHNAPADNAVDEPVNMAAALTLDLLATLRGDSNRYGLADEGVNQRTVFVDTSGISTFDFGLDTQKQEALYRSGQLAAQKFLRLQQPM
jgi:NTE family protein